MANSKSKQKRERMRRKIKHRIKTKVLKARVVELKKAKA